jgi:Ankyrin repeats (3 copies)
MPVRRLPSNPNLDHLRHQAKDLLTEHAVRTPETAQRIREFHPRFDRVTDADVFNAKLSLSDAQLTIAREHGFPSWARLKRHIEKPTLSDRFHLPHHERIEDASFRRAVDLLDAGNITGLRAHLNQYPKLAHQHTFFEGGNYFRNPTLLEFVAENPVRHGVLPVNIVQVARVILDAGTKVSAQNRTLLLVATGSVPRKCGVQIPLIDLLCEYGADPNTAVHAAALHGELTGMGALLRCGARVDLPVSAALGHIDDFNQLLPMASSADRHLAFAMASQFGHVEIVRALLDVGEDPNRYNPVGGHSHTTPFHQAVGEGYEAVVRLLVDRGARVDLKDVLWHATPADWARYAGRMELEEYLRTKERERRHK